MKRLILIQILITFCYSVIYAQEKSSVIETDTSGKYYIHTVQPQETFYGLSKLYNVSIDEIQMCNGNLKALNIGQNIRIPVKDEPSSEVYTPNQITVIDGKPYIVHFVKQGETIYGLARIYGTSAGQIYSANPGMSINTPVAIGQQLFIPCSYETAQSLTSGNKTQDYTVVETIKKEPIEPTTDTDTALYKHQQINATLLLPFYLNKNGGNPEDAAIINKPKEIYEPTYQFLEYYEGMLIALDSLKSMGISVNLDVIESNNDSASANIGKIKTSTELIIGPVFPKTFPTAAAFAKRHSIPIIFPLSTEETNATNPFVVQMNTPQKYRFKAMVDNIIQNHENCNVCIVYNSESLEKKITNQCKAAFSEQKARLDSKQISFEEIFYPSAGAAGLDKAMSKKPQTVVIVLSKQQAFANNIVTKLYQSSRKRMIELWGMPQWELYENLELDFLFDLNFKLITSGEIDYYSPRVNAFIKAYRNRYNTEPTKFSFQGFDQTLFFFQKFATSEDFITELRTTANTDGLHDDFIFFAPNGSTVNTASFIIEYDKASFTRKVTPYNPEK